MEEDVAHMWKVSTIKGEGWNEKRQKRMNELWTDLEQSRERWKTYFLETGSSRWYAMAISKALSACQHMEWSCRPHYGLVFKKA